MLRWGRFAVAYAVMSAAAVLTALVWRGAPPLAIDAPWLVLQPTERHAYSTLLGLTLGGAVVLLTRVAVGRFTWARRLHQELRPLARGLSSTAVLTLAALSALGEELLFRGLLQPWLGLVPQALLFGALHQVRGPGRWVWMAWASAMGLLLGATFQLTGSLTGPIAAHALVNALNLRYLKLHDPEPPRRVLGGLLNERG
jgi:membrane protease YdiL (CAAX protease family)